MSTKLHDFPNNVAWGTSAQSTAATTANTAGASVDLIHGDGRCTAIQAIGTPVGTGPTMNGKIQESTDGTTWTDVSGATFAQAATNALTAISFDRTARYCRHYSTTAGTGSLAVPITAIIFEQLKQV